MVGALTAPRRVRSRGERLTAWLPEILVVLACAGLLGWIQFSFAGMADYDSYFHTRAARELDLHGVRRTFPQTVFSTWGSRYADKDLLFHAVLVPFQRVARWRAGEAAAGGEDLATPGKAAMVLHSALLLLALAGCLRAVRARSPWLWMVLYVVAVPFVIRGLLPVRPGPLGVAFLLLEVALIVRGGGVRLGATGALHTWTHSSFALLPALAVAAVVARLARRERPPLGTLGWALAGPAFGLVVNPYFPNSVSVAWDQTFGVATSAWAGGIAAIPPELFGPELLGMPTSDFVRWAPLFLPAVIGLLTFLATGRRLSTDGLALTLMAGLLLAAGFLSYRFMNFFLPVAIVLGARLWSELAGDEPLGQLARRAPRAFAAAAVLLLSCLVFGLCSGSVAMVRREVAGTADGERLRPAVEFLRRTAPPGDIVYHNFWSAFALLYHFRPEGRYVEALDPVFFQRFDPALFGKALALMRGEAADPHRVVAGDFGARWVFLTRYDDPRLAQMLLGDARFRTVYRDDDALIFRVDEPVRNDDKESNPMLPHKVPIHPD